MAQVEIIMPTATSEVERPTRIAAYPDATFVGRHCYVPLSDETRANICFRTSGYADHYDTLSVKVVDRKQGTIDVVDIKLLELIGMKKSPSPYLADGPIHTKRASFLFALL